MKCRSGTVSDTMDVDSILNWDAYFHFFANII